MHTLARLIDDHETMTNAVEDLMALAAQQDPSPAQAYAQLCDFKAQLHTHLEAEADFIYAEEMRKDPTRLDAEVIAFEREFADLKNNWGAYLAEWSKDAIEADWTGFSSATMLMMRRLLERIEAENAILYPLALQHGRIRLRAA